MAALFVFALWGASPGSQRAAAGVAQAPDALQGPIVSEAVLAGLSPAVRDLPADLSGGATAAQNPVRQNPLRDEPDQGKRGTWDRVDVSRDPLIRPADSQGHTPGLDFDFEGTGNPVACAGCSPPDTNGDVGPNHYIQMVNATKVAIYDKTGLLLSGPFNLGTLFSAAPCTSNAGDPIVLYDPLADRWLLSQFNGASQMCVAISQTADPEGAYFTYSFNVGSFPDYFKFGVWPDAYYMAANEATYTAYAFDRDSMLAGDPATFQKFTGGTNFYLPSDLDGATPPPVGAPNIFYTFKDNTFHGGGGDRLELREFHVDWVTPANSTFTLVASPALAAFTYTVCGFFNFNCIGQAGTGQTVDAVSEWPMHRFPYRNFGSYEALVGNFTVGGGTGEAGAAIRWFELRDTGAGWTLYQEGTYDLNDGHDRFMGSIAMDQDGNIALGYSVSSSTLNPAVRYATRLASDPLGTLGAEAVLINGSGSQTSSNRWGDYSGMAVDPVSDCSFWYTNEYYPVSAASTWKTRVGTFTIPECGGAPVPEADLSITKVGIPDPVSPGDKLTYTITVSNAGPDAAANVTVDDTLPADVTLISVSSSQGGCSSLPCNLGAVASGDNATVEVAVSVAVNAVNPLENTAVVTSDTDDPDPADNSVTIETAVEFHLYLPLVINAYTPAP
jgi:uncharacterized repeat protein (TIGR01451 family)